MLLAQIGMQELKGAHEEIGIIAWLAKQQADATRVHQHRHSFGV